MEFMPFPKIPRLNRSMVITEKIDGTNAQVMVVSKDNPVVLMSGFDYAKAAAETSTEFIFAGSRNRWITPLADNFGFASWVADNAADLADGLGPGQHFGEWYGSGIQRTYGLASRRFVLLNTERWSQGRRPPPCCSVVPVLETTEHPSDVDAVLQRLRLDGSAAVPGFMRPEGIVVYHAAARQMFKVLLEHDDTPKSLLAA
jgi:hypothetical protein